MGNLRTIPMDVSEMSEIQLQALRASLNKQYETVKAKRQALRDELSIQTELWSDLGDDIDEITIQLESK